jgi:4-hydroxybenzoate polyprenyltransferase/phosphoserine phosphatase
MSAFALARDVDGDRAASADGVLCVDLDGTLLAGDLFWEQVIALFKRRPATLLLVPLWLLRGKAYTKRQVAARQPVDARALPYRAEVLALIEESRQAGHHIALVTAADESCAVAVASHLGVFGTVLASDGIDNLSRSRKAACLEQRFGKGRFDYVGNGWADTPAWLAAGRATVVAAPDRLVRHLRARVESVRVLVPRQNIIGPLVRALRPEQWVKNLLVFVPLITSHRLFDGNLLKTTLATAIAFSLGASAIYVANDLLDIQSDRSHPRKRARPFAAGELSIPVGLALAPALAVLSLVLALVAASTQVAALLGIYVFLSLAYSLRVKREPVADVFLLTGLYVLRIVTGGSAAGIQLSNWLLAFAMFFFLNLALVKRFMELVMTDGTVAGRGYRVGDARWMHAVGTSAGYMAVLVLALYASSPEVTALYRRPGALMLLCPLLLFWITRTWFKASRNERGDDPVVDALTDPASYVVFVAGTAILVGAT